MSKMKLSTILLISASVLGSVLSFAFASELAAASEAGSADRDKGKAIYDKKCAICHGFGTEKKIGPNLKSVTDTRPRDWLVSFISNPEKMIKEKDPVAVKLLKQYKNVKMPNPKLSEKEVADVVAYLESQAGSSDSQSAKEEESKPE